MASIVNKIAARTLAGGSRTKPYKWLEGKVNRKTVDNVIAYTTIGSVVAKDTVGCAMYVTQSLNNEKIPEKRRKFVAALDLTNGGLMVASQLILFFAMRKINDKLFYKLFKSFDKEGKAFRSYTERLRVDAAKVRKPIKSKTEYGEEFAGMRDVAYSLFKSVTELAAATILAKRVIVPFIATPLAKKMEKFMDKKGIGVKTTEQPQENEQKTPEIAPVTAEQPAKEEVTNLLELARMNKKQ